MSLLNNILTKLFGEAKYNLGTESDRFVTPLSSKGYMPTPTQMPNPTQLPSPTPTKKLEPRNVVGSKVRNKQTDDFLINVVLPITRQYGIPDPIAAGQFAAEGRLGGLGAGRNNYFNLGAYDKNVDNAFKYETPEAGVEAFAKLLTSDPRYASYFQQGRNPEDILSDYASTYASNPNYVGLITGTPEWRMYSK